MPSKVRWPREERERRIGSAVWRFISILRSWILSCEQMMVKMMTTTTDNGQRWRDERIAENIHTINKFGKCVDALNDENETANKSNEIKSDVSCRETRDATQRTARWLYRQTKTDKQINKRWHMYILQTQARFLADTIFASQLQFRAFFTLNSLNESILVEAQSSTVYNRSILWLACSVVIHSPLVGHNKWYYCMSTMTAEHDLYFVVVYCFLCTDYYTIGIDWWRMRCIWFHWN